MITNITVAMSFSKLILDKVGAQLVSIRFDWLRVPSSEHHFETLFILGTFWNLDP